MTLFRAAAVKRLSRVEITEHSNQHELAGTPLVHLLEQAGLDLGPPGTKTVLDTTLLLLRDDSEPRAARDRLTLYDTRHGKPRAAEWRAYYAAGGEAEAILTSASEGDLAVFALDENGELHVLVAPAGSQWERILLDVLPLPAGGAVQQQLQTIVTDRLSSADRDHAIDLITQTLGLGRSDLERELDWLLDRVAGDDGTIKFPTTRVMAQLGRERAGDVGGHSADEILMTWLEKETQLFYLLEDLEAQPTLDACESVEETISVVKSLLNRRASRRGYSLEIHVEELLRLHGIAFSAQVQTEPGSITDFILPSEEAYHDPDFPDDQLIHIGAKTTARERWRQVLDEAARIPNKYLMTVDDSITPATIDAMTEKGVQLVMPAEVAAPYDDPRIMTIEELLSRLPRV